MTDLKTREALIARLEQALSAQYKADPCAVEASDIRAVLALLRAEPSSEPTTHVSSLAAELSAALNRHSAENESNTPDYILAKFLLGCLAAWDNATRKRERWYGRSPNVGPAGIVTEPSPEPVEPCGAQHAMTGAVCELPSGHDENHRGPLAHGVAQWRSPEPVSGPTLDKAARQLMLEVRGALGIAEHDLRAVLGNGNVKSLKMAADAVEQALRHSPEGAPSQENLS